MSTTLITSRDQKGLHAVNLFEVTYNKARLDEKCAQRLNERGGEFQDGIAKLIAELSLSDRFKNEEVRSNLTYPKEYKGPKPIEEQITALAKIFGLDPAQALAYSKKLGELPEGPEGWFAVISPAVASKLCPEVTGEAEQNCQMLQLVHEKIAATRTFQNYREGQIDIVHLKVHPRTAEKMKVIAEQQPGDILIIVAQLGMRHRGRSSRRSREVFVENEFGLTSISVGSIVLTHPERLVRWEELDMDCAGEEFSDDGDVRFDHAPSFFFDGGKVRFDTRLVSNAVDVYGTASAFGPQ